MFEQAFVEVKTSNKKPIAVLLSLLLQIAVLTGLTMAPLIYTHVLPRAQLKSVFAAPSPQPPTLPKPPMTVRAPSSTTRLFRPISLANAVPVRPMEIIQTAIPPAVSGTNSVADPYSTGESLSFPPIKPPDPPSEPITKKAESKSIRIGNMEASQLLHKVQPAYPPLAKQVHVQGIVEFRAIIGNTGNIEHLQLLRGHPMLVKAAEEAILQWKYKPTLLNGTPVEVITDITVNFTLTQ